VSCGERRQIVRPGAMSSSVRMWCPLAQSRPVIGLIVISVADQHTTVVEKQVDEEWPDNLTMT
jgi:hypothetical protein